MSPAIFINFVYVLAAVLFIFGLKLLGSPATARRGNLVSALGMFIAVLVTLFDQGIVDYKYIILGVAVGALIGDLDLPTEALLCHSNPNVREGVLFMRPQCEQVSERFRTMPEDALLAPSEALAFTFILP